MIGFDPSSLRRIQSTLMILHWSIDTHASQIVCFAQQFGPNDFWQRCAFGPCSIPIVGGLRRFFCCLLMHIHHKCNRHTTQLATHLNRSLIVWRFCLFVDFNTTEASRMLGRPSLTISNERTNRMTESDSICPFWFTTILKCILR